MWWHVIPRIEKVWLTHLKFRVAAARSKMAVFDKVWLRSGNDEYKAEQKASQLRSVPFDFSLPLSSSSKATREPRPQISITASRIWLKNFRMNNALDFISNDASLKGLSPEIQAQVQELLSQTISQTIATVNVSWVMAPSDSHDNDISDFLSVFRFVLNFRLIPILCSCAAFGYYTGDWTSSLTEEAALLRQIWSGKSSE